MLFISVEDFFSKAGSIKRLDRETEKALAKQMLAGDTAARETLIQSYYFLASAFIRRAPRSIQTLNTVYTCLSELEKGVGSFNFLQDGETFSHHLSWRFRQCITRCLVGPPDQK